MKIELDKLDRERFNVNAREVPGLGQFILITPFKAMWQWNDDDLGMRSLVCRDDGTVVSSGFPKFFNYGERVDHDRLTDASVESGSTSLTVKADGSLLIRSVIDGHVHFRTRGCEAIAGDMHDAVMRLIVDRYPELLDASIDRAGSSFLFEYVGPDNQIVVKYDDPEILGLGWIDFSGDSLRFLGDRDYPWLNVRPVDRLDVPFDPKRRVQFLSGLGKQEGVVSWSRMLDGSIHLSKFKTEWYLRLHSLRSQVSPRYMREFCYLNGIRSLDDLKKSMMSEGFDWEVISYLEPIYMQYMDEMKQRDAMVAAADSYVEAIRHQNPSISRKDAAALCQLRASSIGAGTFAYMMARVTQEDAKAVDIADALRLDLSVAQLRHLKKNGIEKLGKASPVND